jgi:hypothetical protein
LGQLEDENVRNMIINHTIVKIFATASSLFYHIVQEPWVDTQKPVFVAKQNVAKLVSNA